MVKSSILLDLNDARSEKIAEVLSNKTAKRILQGLAEGEKCGSDLAKELGVPLNTVSYNLKKLTDAGLIEKSKRFFWSRKGKRMEHYCVADKKIVIMPKQMVKGILPAVVATGLAAWGIRVWTQIKINSGANLNWLPRVEESLDGGDTAVRSFEASGAAAPKAVDDASQGIMGLCTNDVVLSIAQSAWLWFLVGALSALLIYLVWNLWRKR